jgi:Na+-translocating ferredoxin:NAD+ oxidoreductase RnfD subunit
MLHVTFTRVMGGYIKGTLLQCAVIGVGCGILTALIRLFGSLPEGVSFSIIIMNILVPHIERLTTPKPFGSAKTPKKKQSRKKEAGA